MKRLEELLEIGPHDSERLKEAGVKTLRDLAYVQSLPELSQRANIPLDQIQELQRQAARRLKASRYWRRVGVGLVALILAGVAFKLVYRPTSERAEVLGEQLYREGKYDQAVLQFERAIELDPDNENAFANKGGALRGLARPQDALASFNTALTLDPNDVWTLEERGEAYNDLGQYERAIQDFDQAIQLDSLYKYAYQGKAFALHRIGKYQEALQAIDKLIELDPKNAWPHNEGASIYQANFGQYERAYQECKKAVDLDPGEIDYQMNIAEAALTSGRFQEAVDRAKSLLPGDAGASSTGAGRLDPPDQLSMRFIVISALLLQRRTAEARTNLAEFIDYYKSAPSNLDRHWDYTGDLQYIDGHPMDRSSKAIIMNVIQLLEDPPKSSIQAIERLLASFEERPDLVEE